MSRITRLRAAGRGRVAVELDGAPWRVVPAEAVLAASLAPGLELDRTRARALGRALRRVEARDTATAALARRDLPRGLLEDRLAARGVAPAERRHAVDRLENTGVVDDARFARSRAAALAGRGWGDRAIRFDLERHGIASEHIEPALAQLEPESVRAGHLVRRLGGGLRAARALRRRGFGEEAVDAALDALFADLSGQELR